MKPRKMLGDVKSSECAALMALISSQSLMTLKTWACAYARENCLAICEARSGDSRPRAALDAAETFAGKLTPEIKSALNAARDAAKDTSEPVAEAAIRAIATAVAVVRTPTNALGFVFYLAAAVIYDKHGVEIERDEADRLALLELGKAHDSLAAIAVENEPNPAKIDWNC